MRKQRRSGAAAPWGNRILSTGLVPAAQLLANEANWRLHPQEQQEHLSQSLGRVGFVQTVIVNKRSDPAWGKDRHVETVIDGHLRISLAISRGDDTAVPVSYVDLDPDEERWVLATYDPIGALAVADQEKLSELMGLLPDEDQTLAKALHSERKTLKELVAFEAQQDESGQYIIVVNCDSERQQITLLNRWMKEGLKCKAMLA